MVIGAHDNRASNFGAPVTCPKFTGKKPDH